MEKTINLLESSSFTLLVAPPASGKTSFILNLYDQSEESFIFLSPLRALAEEFYARCIENHLKAQIIDKKDNQMPTRKFMDSEKSILIATPETLSEKLWDYISVHRPLFIIDEFHLYYRWGESFRPFLWETLMRISNEGHSILALTATLEDEIFRKWKADFSSSMNNLVFIDQGNNQFKTPPKEIIYLGNSKNRSFRKVIAESLRKKEQDTYLIFCRYRYEVESLVETLKRNQIKAIGCVGGEVKEFQKKMKETRYEVIVSTTCLSHGVNLPTLKKVFITYSSENFDMWLQMAARGGRNGEEFTLYQCNTYNLDKFSQFKGWISSILFDLTYRIWLLWNLS